MSSALQRTRIKFCGLTRPEDIDAAVALGVDAIGLIFAERSPRGLDLGRAQSLRKRIPAFVSCVALVMNADIIQVQAILQRITPDLIQFHGDESAADCLAFGKPYLKAIPMADPVEGEAEMARHPQALGWVLDSHSAGGAGGSGQCFDWQAISTQQRQRLILAGGLTADNVASAIQIVRPWAVDVSSGIESSPGVKNPEKMQRFVAAVRQADAGIQQQGARQ